MDARDEPHTVEIGPDWVVAEMPPGYQNRVREIQMLMSDLQAMSRFGRLLTDTGGRLGEIVRDVFVTLGLDTALMADEQSTAVVVGLPQGRGRLLVHVAADAQIVQKKSPEIGRLFQVLHEVAEDRDRVVFVTNTEATRPPADRLGALTADASAFLTRLGVSHVASTTLFALWKLALQEPDRAREQVLRLHEHQGGTFELPSYTRV
ncbi:MAG TPA: hypothetical protein VM032_19940 [Vicinamibacterales bacterium]|nr:hypothetical protein [Vicinamibacterales bacterium]